MVSLFAGLGGSSLGYKMAGFDVRLAVEWDDNAVECYRANHPTTTIYHGDVAKLSAEEALRLAGVAPGELDILDGSPPCQGFSTAGKRKIDDQRNRLFEEYVRLLRVYRPRAMVMENVTGLVKGKMRLVFAEIMRTLKGAGYRVSCRVLDASYYGVGQARKRTIFVGVREDLAAKPSHPLPDARRTTVLDVLPHALDPARADETNDEHTMPLTDYFTQCWHRLMLGEGVDQIDLWGHYWNTVKINPQKPAPTLPKTSGGRGFATILHPSVPRALSITEAKLLQSLPADYKLFGTFVDRWARIGNSVAPLLMKRIAEHIKSTVLDA